MSVCMYTYKVDLGIPWKGFPKRLKIRGSGPRKSIRKIRNPWKTLTFQENLLKIGNLNIGCENVSY